MLGMTDDFVFITASVTFFWLEVELIICVLEKPWLGFDK